MKTEPLNGTKLFSPESKTRLKQRAIIIQNMRNYLQELGYWEIETPILYPYPEIAPIEQFKVIDPITDREYYLRIAPTEHLKRLMVAGLDAVYEFSRNFRPGNHSYKHSAEFTSLECSRLYSSYKDMMNLTEQLVFGCIGKVTGNSTVTVAGIEYDLEPPWNRISVREAIQIHTGLDILQIESLDSLRAQTEHLDLTNVVSLEEAVDQIIETLILPTLSRPTFLIEFPYYLGGPAKPITEDSRLKERCEAYVGSIEVANMSSHLNDISQLESWHKNALKNKQKILPHYPHNLDEPLFDWLRTGFPDSAVVGIGIDRIVMLATDANDISDVIAFPFATL